MIERYAVADRAAFEAVATTFAGTLQAGEIVALEGDLGAGKTTFVSAVARALGNRSHVASPTFTFWHRYGGDPPLEHLDLYRVDDPAETIELGLEDAFDPASIVFVEWPERVPNFLPAPAIRVRIDGAGEGPRAIEIERP